MISRASSKSCCQPERGLNPVAQLFCCAEAFGDAVHKVVGTVAIAGDADTDLRQCRFFGLSEGFWLRLQVSHVLKLAKQALGGVL